jgi:hypothetical protein
MKMYCESLIDVLKTLSSNSDDQLAYLNEIGIPGNIDEIALEFDDMAILAKKKYKDGEITENQYKLIEELEQKIDLLSGEDNSNFWTEDSLRNAKEWEEIRKLARACIESFSVKV